MNYCPITYEPCGEDAYSAHGIRQLSPRLYSLKDFPYGKDKQLELALEYSDKISFSGVQPKLSARVNVAISGFEAVKSGGTYILKLPHHLYEELPQNEDLTMRLASIAWIEVPFHGMVYAVDGSLIYFIERFDRGPKKRRVAVEDFSQLAGLSRETKYDFSMEQMIPLIEEFCTFPLVEKEKLFRLTLFNFLVGNEDMHLKNFSLLRSGEITALAPAYDLVNSTLASPKTKEEIALPLRGKKSKLKREDLLVYYGEERLGLPRRTIDQIVQNFMLCLKKWKGTIDHSFLSLDKKEKYKQLLQARSERLFS